MVVNRTSCRGMPVSLRSAEIRLCSGGAPMRANRQSILLLTLCLAWCGSADADAGHCRYRQQGHNGSYQVCEAPTDATACAALDHGQRTRDAEPGPGACPVEHLVGTCDKGPTKINYYEGAPEELELGCGFQGGTWINPPAPPPP